MAPLELARAIVVGALLLWAPGYVWARLLVPDAGRIERAFLSVALSIVLLTLCLYLGDVLLSIPLGGASAVGYALVILIAGMVPWLARFARARLEGALS